MKSKLHVLLSLFVLKIALRSSESATTCTLGSFEPSIPADVSVKLGETVRMSCEVLGEQQTPYNWQHSDDGEEWITLLIGAGPPIVYNNTATQGDLLIESVAEEHEGHYRCTLNGINPKCSRSAQLLLLFHPTISLVSSEEESVCVEEGNTVTWELTVDGSPTPQLAFYRASGSTTTKLNNSRFVLNDGIATIQQVERSDDGEYLIAAENECGNASISVFLTVKGVAPTVTINRPKILMSYGSALSVSCMVQEEAVMSEMCSGVEQLSIQWQSPGGVMVSDDKSGEVYVDATARHSATLHITSLTSALVGQYFCIASNDMGSHIGNVTIYGPPDDITEPVVSVMSDSMVDVSWLTPPSQLPISKYTVYYSRHDNSDNYSTAESNSTSLMLSDLEFGNYTLYVTATASYGEQQAEGNKGERVSFKLSTDTEPTPTSDSVLTTIIVSVVLGGLFGIFLLTFVGVLLVCLYYSYSQRINSQQQNWSKDDESNGVPSNANGTSNMYITSITIPPSADAPPSPSTPFMACSFSSDMDPKWEFPRENIQFSEVLCEGITTILYKGKATGLKGGKSMEVSIKACKDGASEDDEKGLLYEMEFLANIGPHPNIISLIQVCSVQRPVCMVMEYMCNGDLLGFLRASRGFPDRYTVSPGIRNQPPPTLELTSRDLLNIATKVTSGMTYLSERKIVHRALCARNILLGSNMDVKIYNIGAFDVDRDSMLKWMAPETLFDRTATTSSDVWSFGVTLWELVTVGGTPYAEIPSEQLYTQLHSGMRMEKPAHCAQELYGIMNSCWERNPTNRPFFSTLHDKLDSLASSKISYLDVKNYDHMVYYHFEEKQKSTAL